MEYKNPLPKRIGLVADSHDQLEALAVAVRILEARGAEALVGCRGQEAHSHPGADEKCVLEQ